MRTTTRKKLTRWGMYAAFVLGVLIVAIVIDWTRVQRGFFQLELFAEMWPEVLTVAARNTLLYTVISFLLGLALGLPLALMKMSTIAPYRWVATVYVEIFRGLPALLTIFLFAFGIPIALGVNIPFGTVGAGVAGLSVVAAAYMAETIRAGIQAVPKGQSEAARSLGMSEAWAMTSIIIPQAFRIIVPPLTNEFVLLIKDTSLLFIAGFAAGEKELTAYGRDIATDAFNSTPIIVAGIGYLVVTIPLTRMVAQLEKRQSRAR